MSRRIGFSLISVGRVMTIAGLLLGWGVTSTAALGQDVTLTEPSLTEESPIAPGKKDEGTSQSSQALETIGKTLSFEELDSAASDLNEALSGARAKLDELRQATELAAMAADLREELEESIQENNRLAVSLAEVQSERAQLETRSFEAERKISVLNEAVETSRVEVAKQADELQERQEKIDEVEAARRGAEEQVRQLELELGDTGQEAEELRNDLAELARQLKATRAELEGANTRVDEAFLARDVSDRELSKVRNQIAGMLRSVLLGGEPIEVSRLEEVEDKKSENQSLAGGTRYEAIRPSNVRAEPDPGSKRVGFAKQGDAVTVLSKVEGLNWFEVETIDGVRGFIFGDLIEPAV